MKPLDNELGKKELVVQSCFLTCPLLPSVPGRIPQNYLENSLKRSLDLIPRVSEQWVWGGA